MFNDNDTDPVELPQSPAFTLSILSKCLHCISRTIVFVQVQPDSSREIKLTEVAVEKITTV